MIAASLLAADGVLMVTLMLETVLIRACDTRAPYRATPRIEIGCRFPLDKRVGDSLSSC